jgi:hypothetical protein
VVLVWILYPPAVAVVVVVGVLLEITVEDLDKEVGVEGDVLIEVESIRKSVSKARITQNIITVEDQYVAAHAQTTSNEFFF